MRSSSMASPGFFLNPRPQPITRTSLFRVSLDLTRLLLMTFPTFISFTPFRELSRICTKKGCTPAHAPPLEHFFHGFAVCPTRYSLILLSKNPFVLHHLSGQATLRHRQHTHCRRFVSSAGKLSHTVGSPGCCFLTCLPTHPRCPLCQTRCRPVPLPAAPGAVSPGSPASAVSRTPGAS